MDDDLTIELELLVEAFRSNIAAYETAAGRARRYRVYAFCRHEVVRRRKLLALIDATTLPVPLSASRRFALWLSRRATELRLSRCEDVALLSELHRADVALGDPIAAVRTRCQPYPYVHGWVLGLTELLDESESERSVIAQSDSRTRGRFDERGDMAGSFG
jgi:hypothetical protein